MIFRTKKEEKKNTHTQANRSGIHWLHDGDAYGRNASGVCRSICIDRSIRLLSMSAHFSRCAHSLLFISSRTSKIDKNQLCELAATHIQTDAHRRMAMAAAASLSARFYVFDSNISHSQFHIRFLFAIFFVSPVFCWLICTHRWKPLPLFV